ncbi:hypothetical protein ACFBZI_07900 [Moraxella sp. ZJ142]|uniref:hypothetical protein n=1 Tax=Moraxella marmotae TaxID=3344520 RepID=UPI0035D51C49
MKFLISIDTDSELIGYEAIALALTLATFDHTVQLAFGKATLALLSDSSTRLYGMVQSLELYDLPPAYHDFDDAACSQLDDVIRQAICRGVPNPDAFDSLFVF